MILVVGGAFQGKKDFAAALTGISAENYADGRTCAFEEIFEKPVVCHFHEYVRRMLEEHRDTAGLVDEITRRNPSLVIISNELGYGVVPVERFDRLYRETTGRVCTQAAAASDEVYRVICGIGTRIK